MKAIKEIFQMIKKWFADPIVRNTIILSSLFAVIIHVLFSIAAPCEFLVGKWGAGDILTYVSTIALGLLAIWQNQRFKEENDKVQELMDKQNTDAQERMAKLTQQANELAVISKIIEAESSRIKQTSQALDKFYSYCDYQKIASLYLNKGFNRIQRDAALADWRSELLNSFNDVLYQLGRDTCVDIGNIIIQVVHLSNAAYKYIDILLKGESSEYPDEMKKMSQKQLDYLAARGVYFVETDAQYKRLVYGNMSLADIQRTYCKINQRKVMEEVMRNEKNANGIR